MNNQIRVAEVRVVGEKGEQLGVMPIALALETARKNNVDLVEVAPTAVPPVCRVIDYGKFRYEQTKKEKVARKSQKISELREIRLRPKIGEHDLEFKVRSIKNFLTEGDKVRVTVMFRGREISHADLGWKLLQKVIQIVEGVGVPERQALMEGRRMHIILAPGVAAQKSKPKETQDAKVKDA
ncbi:MAG: translation initiation factor IF-3 [Dehalococcoidales bacterium]|nr:translation initiation factor IF-3 [Dehalococcoidales bacterium]